jgi:cytoskeleton protein RodZ
MSRVESPTEVSEEPVLEEQVSEPAEELAAEISEDMEVMGPGQILAEARAKMGLTQQDVADKLNFRITLVSNIENELFDSKLPETFNRGYLRNYAKLVNVSQDDILASYEQLNVAKTQASELQSFSKGTEKLAENNQIMWGSYLIIAILIVASVVWWMQNPTSLLGETNQPQTAEQVAIVDKVQTESPQNTEIIIDTPESTSVPVELDSSGTLENTEQQLATSDALILESNSEVALPESEIQDDNVSNAETGTIPENIPSDEVVQPEVILTNVTFTFSGDCWVNISDSTGERIAWGVKKLGYIMKISGQAPFNVTLGKPELVAINFADENIDMTQFNAGNIAKFTLPIAN